MQRWIGVASLMHLCPPDLYPPTGVSTATVRDTKPPGRSSSTPVKGQLRVIYFCRISDDPHIFKPPAASMFLPLKKPAAVRDYCGSRLSTLHSTCFASACHISIQFAHNMISGFSFQYSSSRKGQFSYAVSHAAFTPL